MPLAAFNALNSLQQALTTLLRYIPNVIGFLVILIVGYVIARLVKAAITRLLERLHVDRRLHESPAGDYVERFSPGASPSRLVAGIVFWLIFLFVLTSAIGALKIPAVTAFMNQVLAYLPNVIVAVLIFVIAAALAGGVGALVHRAMGDTPTGDLVRSLAPAVVLSIAVFMILTQLQIAPNIVQILFTAIVGAVALGLALAFGLGGREVASRILEDAYQRQREQVRDDLDLGRERARRDAQHARARVEGGRESTTQAQSDPARRSGAERRDPGPQL